MKSSEKNALYVIFSVNESLIFRSLNQCTKQRQNKVNLTLQII